MHPCDRSPADFRITIDEVTSYGAAWRKGLRWPIDPNPIPIDYVTRAGALWKSGENYVFNLSMTNAPLWWSTFSTVASPGFQRDKLALTAKVAGSAVSKMPDWFVPTEPFVVEISVTPTAGATVYAVQDQIPPGWTAEGINQDGEFDSGAGRVKWGPYFDNALRTFSYRVASGPDAQRTAVFEGVVSADGISVRTSGQRNVQLRSRLRSLLRPADGEFRVSLLGELGAQVIIETSSDLTDWRPLTTLTNDDGHLLIADPAAVGLPQRFYRVRGN